MSEDRDRIAAQDEEGENEQDVEAHRLAQRHAERAEDGESTDDVEAHRLGNG